MEKWGGESGMIDMHSHILPMVDDGANSVRMALEMLEIACRNGTHQIVLTPHHAPVYGFENPKEKIQELFSQLQEIVWQQRIPIRIYLGTEYLMEDPERFAQEWQSVQTLNDSRYLLMEFFFDISEQEMLRGIDAVQAKGWIPVIAHPERYDCIQVFPGAAESLVQQGALLQMNKASPLGGYGRHTRAAALELLERGLYTVVGSDTHRPEGRDPNMAQAYDFIYRCFGRAYCESLFERNPQAILENMELEEGERSEEFEDF